MDLGLQTLIGSTLLDLGVRAREKKWRQINQSENFKTCITVGDSTFVKGLGDWKSRLIWVDLTVETEFGDSWFLSTIGVEVGGGAAGELGSEA